MTIPVRGIFIDGAWAHPAHQDTVDVLSPVDGRSIAKIVDGGAIEVDRAVKSARKAIETSDWAAMTATERGRVLHRISLKIAENAVELAELETQDTGRPLRQAEADMVAAARYFEFYGAAADKLHGETIPYQSEFFVATQWEPHGISAHIIPWNYPAQMFARTVAPSLAAGNAAVVKPAEDACLTPLRLAEIAVEAGLPPGILNIVSGRGRSAGEALINHTDIDFISFTGSPEVGVIVQTAAATRAVGCTLELGGKSPHLVFADADLDLAIPAIVSGIAQNAGQTCSAGSRVLIEASVFDEVASRLAERFRALRVGTPGMNLDLGPVINAGQMAKIEAYCERAEKDGIRLLAEGALDAECPSDGFYVTPKLYGPVPRGHPIAREEVFGPVLALLPFNDDADALALANDSEFGLLAGIWTCDGSRAMRLARKIRAGQVYINGFGAGGGIELPFGGVGRSGHGREKGLEALREFSTLKTIINRHG